MMTVASDVFDDVVTEINRLGVDAVRSQEGGYVIIIIENYVLPAGWSKRQTQLLLKLPQSFPNGKPDMFWTDADLTLANGREPDRANVFENVCGRRWRRFSWHPQKWTPGKDSINTFLGFIDRRLAQAK